MWALEMKPLSLSCTSEPSVPFASQHRLVQPTLTCVCSNCKLDFIVENNRGDADPNRCHGASDRTLNKKRKPEKLRDGISNFLSVSLSAQLLDRIWKSIYTFQGVRSSML